MRFPTDEQHIAIMGANGSGKTQAAQWLLSHRDFQIQPWLIYNFKRDESIDAIPHARHIGMDEIPKTPGIYIAHPRPDEQDLVEDQMMAIWERGRTGIYIDEGYMVGQQNPAFRLLLTQGRSLHIPMIILSQRPKWMDTFVFTESAFYQVFRLQHRKDRATVAEYIPMYEGARLPEYYSYYYDVGQNQLTALRPVPPIEVIHGTFERRLRRKNIAI